MITLQVTERELACLKDAVLVLTLEHADLEVARLLSPEVSEGPNQLMAQTLQTISDVAQKLRDAGTSTQNTK